MVMAAVVALGGCGSDDEKSVAPPLTPPPGFTVVSDAEAGFAMALPEDWKQVPLANLAAFEAEAEKIQAQNGQLKPAIDTARTLVGRGGEVFALDPADNGATNVNLIVVDAGNDDSLEQVAKDATTLLSRGGAENITQEPATLAEGPAVKVSFRQRLTTDTVTRLVDETQYYVLRHELSYVLTLVGTGPDLDAIAQSLRIA
jgi:hypothetical protein